MSSSELKAAIARAEKAEKELESLRNQNAKFEEVYGMTRTELVDKLKQIRELVKKDMTKMTEQEAEIKRQKELMAHIRTQLLDVKKELLVSGARLTPQQFREALTNYLKDIRAQIVAGNALYDHLHPYIWKQCHWYSWNCQLSTHNV